MTTHFREEPKKRCAEVGIGPIIYRAVHLLDRIAMTMLLDQIDQASKFALKE